MKNSLYIILLITSVSFGQIAKPDDVKLPSESFGASTSFGSHVNESNGKVSISLDITNIASRSLSFPIDINYQGDNVTKQATYKNRYLATGILGVGWNMVFPKIVADYKNTSARDDDSYYLNGVELVCINRPDPSLTIVGTKIWEFKLNSSLDYKIKYYEVSVDYDLVNFTVEKIDYWEVTDDKGRTYIYGNTDNTRESVLAWGNWIGDSKAPGASKHTIVWNISTLKDQYNNNLQFSYLKVENGYSATSLKHTEASYLQQIYSSTGERVIFNYGNKTINEYYEPHTETSEPDAYQEHYEKKFLSNIKTYNSSNSIISTHEFTYTIADVNTSESSKRYLQTVINKNAQNESLPPHKFEYYLDGEFKGHLKKRTIPNGGSFTYNYTENVLFTNSINNTEFNNIQPEQGHMLFGRYYSDNYKLLLYSTNISVPFNSDDTAVWGNFYIIRDRWTGRKWIREKFDIPDSIRVIYQSGGYFYLDNVKFVFADDFYGFLVFNRNTDFGTVHIFHLQNDGTWNYTTGSSIHTGGNNDNDHSQDPAFISGDNFIAIGNKSSGRLITYRWNNRYWYRDIIEQGTGNYYFGAKNNFIISLNTVSGYDMPTIDIPNSSPHYDRYYIHYLNAEKEWKTKSWTASMTNVVGNISGASYFYPSNAMSSFVAGDNPEYFIRWDNDYNIVNITGVGAYNDIYPFFPLVNNVFAGFRTGDTSRPKFFLLSAFDGVNWYQQNTNHETHNGFGHNKAAGLAIDYNAHSLFSFNPNTASWSETYLPFSAPPANNYINMDSFAFANDLFMSGDRIYRLNNNGYSLAGSNSYFYYQQYAKSGGDYLYDHHWRNDDPSDYDGDGNTAEPIGESKYYYLDKTSNLLNSVQLNGGFTNNPQTLNLYQSANRRAEQFGGKYPFFSRTNLNGIKLIDNKFNNVIKDIVLSEVLKDNGAGKIEKTAYTFSNSNTLLDDETIIYGKVSKSDRHISFGNSNGKIIKYYDTGSTDASRAGLLLREEIYSHSGYKEAEVVYTQTKFTNQIGIINTNYTWRITKRQDFVYPQSQIMEKAVTYTYDDAGNITSDTETTSEGQTRKTWYEYAHNLFPFVATKNFRGLIAKRIVTIDNEVIAIEKTNWVQSGNNVHINQNLSGTTEANVRINSDVLVVDNYGNVLETSNGKGISKSVLMGYNHKYVVATVNNVKHSDLVNSLDVSYSTLQTYNAAQLKIELLKLYSNFPLALISIDLYDNYGRLITKIDARKNEINYTYDNFGRVKYTTDKNGNILSVKEYNYKNQ